MPKSEGFLIVGGEFTFQEPYYAQVEPPNASFLLLEWSSQLVNAHDLHTQ